MKYFGIAAVVAASQVAGHAIWQDLWVNGVDQGSTCVRMPLNNNPVSDPQLSAIRCNAGTSPVAAKCAVKAGDTVTIEMHQQIGQRSCANEGIGGAHWGPVLGYLSKVSDAASDDGSGGWFKIYQNSWAPGPAGVYDGDYWGTKDLDYCCGKLSFNIPTGIPSGDYLLRAEAIALHNGGQAVPNGAQFYMSCYQLTVSGGSGSVPPTVQFPGAYGDNDPGIHVNIHMGLSTYIAPGPTVIPGGASKVPNVATFSAAGCAATSTLIPGGAAPAPTSPAKTTAKGGAAPTTTASTKKGKTTTTTKSKKAKTTTTDDEPAYTPPSQTTTAAGPGQTMYGQCGGGSWAGPFTCQAGTCKKLNDYYSQCA